jgi:serine/threonine-protein kinase
VLRRIGAGGLGVVYEARHQRLGKRVAIKTLNEGSAADPNVRERFLREGRAAARLRHPNVVDVSDVAFDGDQPYLVLELLEGEELNAVIQRESPLSVQRTVDLLLPIVSALAHAHDSGVLHRDLKPQNVFLSRSPSGLVIPKVVDFGISKLLEEPTFDLTSSGAFLGSPPYMSPEQAAGSKLVDVRSDQFSLGVIAYECLTGFRPFSGDSLYSLLNAVITHEPPSVHLVRSCVPQELAAAIARMMAKAPRDRFDSMRSVGAVFLSFASPPLRFAYAAEFTNVANSQDNTLMDRECTDTAECSSTRRWAFVRAGGWSLSHGPRRTVALIASATVVTLAALGALLLRPTPTGGLTPVAATPSPSAEVPRAIAPPRLPNPPLPSATVAASRTDTHTVSQPVPKSKPQLAHPHNRAVDTVRASDHARSDESNVAGVSDVAAPVPTLEQPIALPPERGANGALIIP